MEIEAGPLDILKHLMEENDVSASDLGRLLGGEENAVAVLNGMHPITDAYAAIIAERFNVDASLFLPEE